MRTSPIVGTPEAAVVFHDVPLRNASGGDLDHRSGAAAYGALRADHAEWTHPRGSRAGWLETGLGYAVALVAFRALAGVASSPAGGGMLWDRVGPMRVREYS